MRKITRALISVSEKRGVVEFARNLEEKGVEILSTGGTAKILRVNGVGVKDVSDYTGFPEMLDGRVKTLHPKIHGGLLGVRDNPEHASQMAREGIEPIDLVAVNLYPFEDTVAKEGCSFGDAIENIDIGGPTMLRSAAKNYQYVAVVVDPDDYRKIIKEMTEEDGFISPKTRFFLAQKVFQLTAKYDGSISNYLGKVIDGEARKRFPDTFSFQVAKAQDLRYGENPHQEAAFYRETNARGPCVSSASQIQGKDLSFNNILDIDAALETVKEFPEIACVIIKHTNPCGAAISQSSLPDAYVKARACDPVSAFGGIVGLNRKVDKETAAEITSTFLEAVIAPDFDEDALEILATKKNLRVLRVPFSPGYLSSGFDMKKVAGGLLIQDRDLTGMDISRAEVVTERKPTPRELNALSFAWKVCKHVKSNAIVYAGSDQVVGIGAGQMSRVDSVKIGVIKANFPVKGTVLASDAMFPFRDSVDRAAEAGVTAIIQPGGSLRDEEVIKAADKHNIAMVFTGIRHFRH